MLPIRPHPIPNESLRGYIGRVALANGYSGPDWMMRHLSGKALHQSTLATISAAIGKSTSQLAGLEGIIPGDTDARHLCVLGGRRLPSDFWRLSLRQICPRCLAESGFAEASWEDMRRVTCAIHQTTLVDACPSCSQPLSWTLGGLTRCQCGMDLCSVEPEAASSSLLVAERYAFGGTESSNPPFPAVWLDLSDRQRLKLISLLGDLAPSAEAMACITHAKVRLAMQTAGRILSDWPAGLMKALETIDRGEPSLRRSLGRFLSKVDALPTAPAFVPLREAISHYVGEVRTAPCHPQVLKHRNATAFRKRSVGIARASAELALARGSVKKLIRAGRLAGRVAAAGKRCFTSIPPNAVEAYRSLRTASLTTREVRLEFGLSRDRFRELCHAGILPVLEGRDQTEQAVWRIDRHRLDVLKRQLDDAASASPTEATENVISLATACRTRLIEGELALTLSAILDGRLPVIGRLKGLAVIPSLVVDADRHLELRDEWRTEQSNTLSIVEVAEQMAVKQEVAYHLVRQGLLQTATAATHRRNQRVAMQQLQEFKTAYVWLRDLARGARTSPKHLRTLLDKEGIRPISGPDVDGCRQTLFRRACLQARPAILGTISLPEDVAT